MIGMLLLALTLPRQAIGSEAFNVARSCRGCTKKSARRRSSS
jgi:hypothetical protein